MTDQTESEQAKPVCRTCGQSVDDDNDKIYDLDTGATRYASTHMHPSRCITALRAALDQERADNAKLRSIAHAADVFVRVEDSTARTMREWQLAFDLLRTALLSGRGRINDE